MNLNIYLQRTRIVFFLHKIFSEKRDSFCGEKWTLSRHIWHYGLFFLFFFVSSRAKSGNRVSNILYSPVSHPRCKNRVRCTTRWGDAWNRDRTDNYRLDTLLNKQIGGNSRPDVLLNDRWCYPLTPMKVYRLACSLFWSLEYGEPHSGRESRIGRASFDADTQMLVIRFWKMDGVFVFVGD